MKKNTYILLLVILSTLLFSCSMRNRLKKDRGNDYDDTNVRERNFSKKDMDLLKSRNTVFFFSKNDSLIREDIEKAINEVWDFTPMEFAYYCERGNYPPDLYSYFTIEGYVKKEIINGIENIVARIYYLTLTVKYEEENRRGRKKDRSINYCRIDLSPINIKMKQIIEDNLENSTSVYQNMIKGYKSVFNPSEEMKEVKRMYREAGVADDFGIEDFYQLFTIPNWNPTHLQCYLQDIQSKLKENKREFLYDLYSDKNALNRLKEDTLFIAEYNLKREGFSLGMMHDEKKLLKKYKHPYKVVPIEEINERILAKKETYLLEHTKNGEGYKFIRIYNTEIGKVYQSSFPASWNTLKAKDFKRIFK
jgi:hypothetical protein